MSDGMAGAREHLVAAGLLLLAIFVLAGGVLAIRTAAERGFMGVLVARVVLFVLALSIVVIGVGCVTEFIDVFRYVGGRVISG